MTLVEIAPAVALEATVWGEGDPVVFISTALTPDESLPVAKEAALESGWRKVFYHRRGYGGSSRAPDKGSIAGEAMDCLALMWALGIERAHLVGLSLSCAIALQAAAQHPERVLSLTLIEPPPTHASNAAEFTALSRQLMDIRSERGLAAALETFLGLPLGGEAVAVLEKDARTFFDSDLPALLDWQFSAEQFRRITCPVLYVRGTASGGLFAAVPEMIRELLPHARRAAIEGAGHSLELARVPLVAEALAAFLREQAENQMG
jgi:pimeloyl-ACP methyl ester carboxylesterase